MALSIKNITKRFGGVTALRRCSFDIERNKITAIIGPNGAGKTTLFDVISGAVRADKGRVIFDGMNLTELADYEIANSGIVRTWQQVRLFKNLTLADHLAMVENNDDTKLLSSLLRWSHQNRPDDENYIRGFGIDLTSLKLRGTGRPLNTLASELSYGQRKLLQLALALRKPHELLLLDEPVAGVNQVIQQKIESLLVELKKKSETVVIIEHDIEFVKKLADKVVVMDAGRVLIEGLPGRVLSDRRVIEAYLGE